MYDETTNEWQFIESFFIGRLLVAHGTLYGLSNTGDFRAQNVRIDCYDPEENKWTNKTNPAEICRLSKGTTYNPVLNENFERIIQHSAESLDLLFRTQDP